MKRARQYATFFAAGDALKMEHALRDVQVQKMMPQTMQSLQLLTLPLLALEAYLSGVVLANPFLETRFDGMETPLSACAPSEESSAFDEPSEYSQTGAGPLLFREHIYALERESLFDHLRAQAGLCAFSETEAAVARHLISCISAAGYLEESLPAAAAKHGCEVALAERVLGVIHGFSPCGVGARDLSECLLLQADPRAADYDILTRLLREDLAALAGRKFEFLARKYKVSRQRIQKILDYVQTLNPKPGSCFSAARFQQYVLPDATVTLSGHRPEIWVGGKAGSLLAFDPNYMKDVTDSEACVFLRQKRIEAVNLINSLDMRSRVLGLLVGYLAVEQRAFFRTVRRHSVR